MDPPSGARLLLRGDLAQVDEDDQRASASDIVNRFGWITLASETGHFCLTT
jgi:hypothetical protein